jgi:leader peptidase (prepilin peptidase) / N-methyltransferase
MGWLLDVALVAVLVPAAVVDLRRRIIPNRLTAAGAAVGLALLTLGDPVHVGAHLVAAAGAGGFFLAAALARPGELGMGDVKLAAVLGLYLGAAVVAALIVAVLAATAVGLAGRRTTVPLGPFLALGGVLALVVR